MIAYDDLFFKFYNFALNWVFVLFDILKLDLSKSDLAVKQILFINNFNFLD